MKSIIINEENISEKIKNLYQEDKNYSIVFDKIGGLVKKAVKEEKYASIESNYVALFIYEMIKKRVDKKQFNQTMKHIYTKLNYQDVERFASRFFNERDVDITVREYLSQNRYNNDFSDWDNMGCIFYDIKNKKYAICQENIHYIQSILEHVGETQVGGLYEGKFQFFINNFKHDFLALKPIFDTFIKNPASTIEKVKYHSSFIGGIINLVAHDSYELSKSQNKKIYKTLNSLIPNFQECCNQELVSTGEKAKFHDKDFKLDLSVTHFLNDCGLDVVSIIHEIYLKKYKDLETIGFTVSEKSQLGDPKISEDFKDYIKNKKYSKLSSEVSSSLEVSLEDRNFKLDLTDFDVNAPVYRNYILLKALGMKSKQGNFIEINDEIKEYVHQLLKNSDSLMNIGIYLPLDEMKKHLDYVSIKKTVNLEKSVKFQNPKL